MAIVSHSPCDPCAGFSGAVMRCDRGRSAGDTGGQMKLWVCLFKLSPEAGVFLKRIDGSWVSGIGKAAQKVCRVTSRGAVVFG